MLRYLIIPLCDSAVSFCHYKSRGEKRLIGLDELKKAIKFSMLENLTIQYVFPDYDLPQEYLDVIETEDHWDIRRKGDKQRADVYVCEGWKETDDIPDGEGDTSYLLRISWQELINLSAKAFADRLEELGGIKVALTGITDMSEEDLKYYGKWLDELAVLVADSIKRGIPVVCNLLTERLALSEMHNCLAGVESITLAPDGRFYVCPGFYFDKMDSVGDLEAGLAIPNQNLYKLDFAPICRRCDAFHCKRCVYLNKKTTREVNTPSHEQCVVSHQERKASRRLLEELGNKEIEIEELEYDDPFYKK